jgi:hypothetical protein
VANATRRHRVRSDKDRQRDRERDRQRKRPVRTCPICKQQYHPTCGDQKYCSRKCGGEANRKKRQSCRIYIRDCTICGKPFTGRTSRQVTCGDSECQRLHAIQGTLARYHSDPVFRDSVLAQAHARRADKLGLPSQDVLLTYLIKRDKGRCQIPACLFFSRKVAPLGSKGPDKPSIDHIVPLSRGGTHERSNVQLGHDRCNRSKHNCGGGEQLRLIG